MVFNNGLLAFSMPAEGALIAVWGGRNLLDAGGSHFIVELLVVPLRQDLAPNPTLTPP
jgi:hypothetical protein